MFPSKGFIKSILSHGVWDFIPQAIENHSKINMAGE